MAKKLELEELVYSPNIAQDLSEKELEEIGFKVVEGYEEDNQSRSDWLDKYNDWLRLSAQVVETKSSPWPGAANVKYPLITISAMQFGSRAYPALIPGPNIVQGRTVGFDYTGEKTEAAIRVGKHMSYQLMEEMENWEEDMDKLCTILPIVGCLFKKTYFSNVKNTNVSELLYAKNLVVNYWAKSLEDCQRATEIIELSENDVYERVAKGLFLDEDLQKQLPEINEVSDEINGTTQPQEDETTPYTFLEQHTFCDLDGDGYKEPYIVTVHLHSRKVVRIVARFDEDGIERDINGNLLSIRPVQYYTKYGFVPNPDGGFYDIGFGTLLSPLNESINTIINQLLDAGTISNRQAGFISRGIRMKGGNQGFKPGEWKSVHATGDDLRKGIVPLPVREPSGVLFNLLQFLLDGGQKVSSVTDLLMGENPGQNQPATTTMAVLEQGLKVFNSIYKRLHRSMKKEFKKIHRLNRLYLPPEQYFAVLDSGQQQAEKVEQTDYQLDVTDVIPYSDPNVSSQAQKLAKAQGLFELLQTGTINVQEAVRRMLEAQEQPGIDVLMQVEPPQPDPEVELEQFKLQDESERGWEDLRIKRILAENQTGKTIAEVQRDQRREDREDARLMVDTLKEEKQENESNKGRV